MASERKETGSDGAHEPSDVNVRGVGAIGLVLLGTLVATMAIVWFLTYETKFKHLTRLSYGSTFAPQPAEAPPNLTRGTRLDTRQAKTLRDLQASQAARLNGYGWSDTAAGFARIPIERAIELMAQGDGR